jgi:outer membrane lipoprotein-sorting protein
VSLGRGSGARVSAPARAAVRAICHALAACTATAALADAAPEVPSDVATVMRHFAASRGVEAAFREEKTLPLLAEPLVSEGVLYYAPPGRLARFTTAPESASLLVDGDRLRIEDGLGVEEIDLASHAGARQFVDQLLVLFRGDSEALLRDYAVSLAADAGGWSLLLAPKSRVMRALIEEIALSGRGRVLDEMVVRGSQGEVTRTTYSRIDADRPFSADELASLFPEDRSPRSLESGAAPTP